MGTAQGFALWWPIQVKSISKVEGLGLRALNDVGAAKNAVESYSVVGTAGSRVKKIMCRSFAHNARSSPTVETSQVQHQHRILVHITLGRKKGSFLHKYKKSHIPKSIKDPKH